MKYEKFRKELARFASHHAQKCNAGDPVTTGEVGLFLGLAQHEVADHMSTAVSDDVFKPVEDAKRVGYLWVDRDAMTRGYDYITGIRRRLLLPLLITLILIGIGWLWAYFIVTYRERTRVEMLIAQERASVELKSAQEKQDIELRERKLAVVRECAKLFLEYDKASVLMRTYALQLLQDKGCPVEPIAHLPGASPSFTPSSASQPASTSLPGPK